MTDPRFSDEEIEQVHCDFARTIQDDIFNVIKNIISASDFSNGVILSGGIAQNSTLINYISEELSVEVFTSTSCSDRGNSLGALEYCSEIPKLHTSPFLGFDVDTEHPPKELKNAELEGKSFINKTAELLNSGEVIATLISKSELGARALGNRSILSYASDPERKDYLNRSVKHREMFRPFAPICLSSNVPHILENPKTSSYMTQCFKVKESFKENYPSAVHVDNTARAQVCGEDAMINNTLYKVLEELNNSFNVMTLLNTSFNDAGEPIVNCFKDACRKNNEIMWN